VNAHHLEANRTIVLVFVLLFCTFGGCSTVTVTAVQASKADDIYTKTVVALWWGGSDPEEKVDCQGNGLQFVSVKTNWLYSLCSVLTLGAVVPADIQYRCTSVPLQENGPIGELQ
jgi:hypothetical protein